MKQITIQAVMGFGGCWSEEQLLEASGGKRRLTVEQLLALPIDLNDKKWALFHEKAMFLSKEEIKKIASAFYEAIHKIAHEIKLRQKVREQFNKLHKELTQAIKLPQSPERAGYLNSVNDQAGRLYCSYSNPHDQLFRAIALFSHSVTSPTKSDLYDIESCFNRVARGDSYDRKVSDGKSLDIIRKALGIKVEYGSNKK